MASSGILENPTRNKQIKYLMIFTGIFLNKKIKKIKNEVAATARSIEIIETAELAYNKSKNPVMDQLFPFKKFIRL